MNLTRDGDRNASSPRSGGAFAVVALLGAALLVVALLGLASDRRPAATTTASGSAPAQPVWGDATGLAWTAQVPVEEVAREVNEAEEIRDLDDLGWTQQAADPLGDDCGATGVAPSLVNEVLVYPHRLAAFPSRAPPAA